jgi:predicted permease
MGQRKTFSIPVILALCLAAIIGGNLLGIYLLRDMPTDQQACAIACAKSNQTGYLAYVYDASQTAGMRGKGPAECQCR